MGTSRKEEKIKEHENVQIEVMKTYCIPVPFFSIQPPWLGVPSPSFSNPNVKTDHIWKPHNQLLQQYAQCIYI